MNIADFKNTAEQALKTYQQLLKMQAHDIKLDFVDDPDSEYLVYADTETESLGGIIYLHHTGIVKNSKLQNISIDQFLDEIIIQYLLFLLFEKREHDSIRLYNTYKNIVSKIIWRYVNDTISKTNTPQKETTNDEQN